MLAVASVFFPALCGGVTLDVLSSEIACGELVGRTEASLTLRGSANAADLAWIADNCRELRILDLSGLTIEPCSLEKGLANGLREFPGGVLPAYSLSGLTAQTLVLPEGISEICDGALLGSAVTGLTLPASVRLIGQGAFAACEALRHVSLGASVEIIGPCAFRGCVSLASVEADGSRLVEIGEKAFSGCRKLSALTFTSPDPALTAIGDEAFGATDLQTLDLSACTALRSIGRRAFAACASLEELVLPSGVVYIGDGVLFGCQSLRTFALPEALNDLPAMALAGASALEDISLHDGVRSLGEYSLTGIDGITGLSLPSSLREIGTGVFEGWSSLQTLMVDKHSEVPILGADVWAGVNQSEAILTVAPGLEAEFAAAPQWKEFMIRTPDESTLDRVPAIDDQAAAVIDAKLENSVLTVKSSEKISAVTVYDTDGRAVFGIGANGSTALETATGLPVGRIYIVALRLHSGVETGIKLVNIKL